MFSEDMSQKTTPEEEITWLQTSADKSAEAYFIKFNLNDKRIAHHRYTCLLESQVISDKCRNELLNGFAQWKGSNGPKFWLDRASHVSAITTATALVKGSVPYATESINQNASTINGVQSQASTTPIQSPTLLPLDQPSVKDKGYLALEDLDETPTQIQTEVSKGAPSRKRKPTNKDAGSPETETPVDNKKKKGHAPLEEFGKRSFQGRYQSLGQKWVLGSGIIVEDVLFDAGKQLAVYHPIHSFMIDTSDLYTKSLFTADDWNEIISGIPRTQSYSPEASLYLDGFDEIKSTKDLRSALKIRPDHPEQEIIHSCLVNWLNIYELTSPSPFMISASLSESWWMTGLWGVTVQLCKGVEGSYIINGEKAGIDSASRRNFKEHVRNIIPHKITKKVGTKADLIWRCMKQTERRDWAIAEAALVWDDAGHKYIHESPSMQRVGLCWGSMGENITRLVRWKKRIVDPDVKNLSSSLLAIHQLLLFRASTIQLMGMYDLAAEERNKERRTERHDDLELGEEWSTGDD
ncbi:hypothetical protein BGX27_001675, partial [Mortierella sp. AM989]